MKLKNTANQAALRPIVPKEVALATSHASDSVPAELLDESAIDPAKIPHGKSVLTKQGRVMSTAPDPTPYHTQTLTKGPRGRFT